MGILKNHSSVTFRLIQISIKRESPPIATPEFQYKKSNGRNSTWKLRPKNTKKSGNEIRKQLKNLTARCSNWHFIFTMVRSFQKKWKRVIFCPIYIFISIIKLPYFFMLQFQVFRLLQRKNSWLSSLWWHLKKWSADFVGKRMSKWKT